MKKFIISVLLGVAVTASASSYREQLFFNGWNLYVTNFGVYTPGQTNNLFTTPQGQILYSLTNNIINGTLVTNTIAPDAFDMQSITYADANGDINANAAIHYVINNTNYIPIAVTNSQGQWFVPTAPNTTNYSTAAYATAWPLASSAYPTYMYPASTNLYPSLPGASATNVVTFYFQRGWAYNLGANALLFWDTTTNVFAFSVTGQGATPFNGATNIPTTFMQGANRIRCAAITESTNSSGNVGGTFIINQLSIGQPVP